MHSSISQESDPTDNKIKHAISFAEKKLMRMIKEEGVFHDDIWKLSHEIALLSLNLGVTFIKKSNFSNAETFILKAKKVTEPPNSALNWESRLEWQIVRFNIFQNLAIVYQNQKRDEKALELLKSLLKHLKPENIMTQNAEIMISSIDNLYVNLANLCYTLNHYDEAVLYSNLGIKFMNLVVSNPDLLRKIEFVLRKNGEHALENFVHTQKMLTAYLFHLIGKSELKRLNIASSLSNYQQAHSIAYQIKGGNDETTIKYAKKIKDLEERINMKESQLEFDSLSDGNFSEIQSPGQKKMRFIQSFVKNHDPSSLNITSPTRRPTESSKRRISWNFHSPRHAFSPNSRKISEGIDSPRIEKSTQGNQIFIKFSDEQAAISNEPENPEKKRPFLLISERTRSSNKHTKSMTNYSDEMPLFLIKKPKEKGRRLFHKSNYSQQIPYLKAFVANGPSQSSSQRQLIYHISSLSNQQSTRTRPPTIKTEPSTLYADPLLTPEPKYQLFMTTRPGVAEKAPNLYSMPIKRPNAKIPSITINSIGDLLEHNLQPRPLKTPKSSFSSINTPGSLIKKDLRMRESELSGPFKKMSIRKQITVKIPKKQASNANIKTLGSFHNTPAVSEHRKKNCTGLSSSQMSLKDSRKFSVQTAGVPPHHASSKPSMFPDKKPLIPDTNEPTPLQKPRIFEGNSGVVHQGTVFRRQQTVNVNNQGLLIIGKNVDKSEEKDSFEEEEVDQAVRILQKWVRGIFARKRLEEIKCGESPVAPQRISAGSKNAAKDSIILRNLKTSETNSNNTSKFSPRREELISGKIIENNSVDEEKSQADSFSEKGGENWDFLPWRMEFNKRILKGFIEGMEYFKIRGFSLNQGKHDNGVILSIFLRSAIKILEFSWIFPMERPKIRADFRDNNKWKIINLLLDMKLNFENLAKLMVLQRKEFPSNILNESKDFSWEEEGDFRDCIEKLRFFLRNSFVLKRKITGRSWVFEQDLQSNSEKRFIENELKSLIRDRKKTIKEIACKDNNPNDLLFESFERKRLFHKMHSLDHSIEKLTRNNEEYSMFSKISSPATSEANYQKNRAGLPPMVSKPQQRPSISLSLYDNHIRLIKKDGIPSESDYQLKTLTQPPLLLTQLRTALSTKEMNLSMNNIKSETPSKKGSTVKEVSEDIIELSEDTERKEQSLPNLEEKNIEEAIENDIINNDYEKQSVIIKKDSISNEYIAIENAIKAFGITSESGSPQSPSRRSTFSPRQNRLDRKSIMKKFFTGINDVPSELIIRSNSRIENDESNLIIASAIPEGFTHNYNVTLSKSRMNAQKRKQKFVREELLERLKESQPKRRFGGKRLRPENYRFRWEYHKDLKPIPCPQGLFPVKSIQVKPFSEKIVNCFEDNEIVFQTISKIENEFFVMAMRLGIVKGERILDFIKGIDQEGIQRILSRITSKIELLQINQRFKVTYSMSLPLSDFNTRFLDSSLCQAHAITNFFNYRKLSSKNLHLLALTSRKIGIEDCRMVINDDLQKPQKTSLKTSIPPFVTLEHPDPEELVGVSDSTMVLHDPEIVRMRYYNSVRILNKPAYYERFREGRDTIYFRVRFDERDFSAKIAIYRPFRKRIEYQNLGSQIVIEKLINFLQINNHKTKSTMLKALFLSAGPNAVGRNLSFSVNRPVSLPAAGISPHNGEFFLNFAQNIFSKRDHPIIYHFFSVRTFYRNFPIENLGRAYAKISVFRLKENKKGQFMHNFESFFLLEIYQNSATRYKLQKFIVTANDLKTYINFQFSEKSESTLLTELYRNVFSNFVYCKDKLYKSLQLPFNRFSKSLSKRFSLLKMDLNKFGIQKAGIGKFLKPVLNEYRIIYQGIRKIFGLFSIFTVKKHHILKFWSISFYFPTTNREFSISLSNSDIFRMTSGFFEALFPISMAEIQGIFSQSSHKRLNYQSFSQGYEKLMAIKSTKSERAEVSVGKSEGSNGFKNSKVMMNFVEIKFWESILSQAKFTKNVKGKIAVNIDNLSLVAVEHLFDQLVVLKNKNLIIFEVMNERLDKFFTLENSLEPFKYSEAHNVVIRLKIHELSSTKISHDNFCLKELLHLYICEKNIKKKKQFDLGIENLKTFSITHAFLRSLSTFLYLKIRNIEKVISIGVFDDFEHTLILQRKFCPTVRLNCKLQVQSLYFNNHKKWLLIYKHVLTVKPRQMIAVLYSQYHRKILVYLYNNKNCKAYRRIFSVEKMIVHIPYLNEMLALQEFNVIGFRILKTLKNTLLVSAFFNLCL